MNDTIKYDLFLSYNSQDRDAVAEIRQQLLQPTHPLKTFIDRESLTLGKRWFEEIQDALVNSRAVAVFYGKHGLGRWQNLEMILALDLQATTDSDADILVIPVLLPGADLNNAPRFLLLNSYLDLRSGHTPSDLSRLAQAVLRQPITLDTLPADHELRNPYRGLDYFREQDAPLFFGRDQVAEKLLHKVNSAKLITLVGNSGTGKSSVIRAGLIPLLRKQHAPDKTWEVLVCIPALNNVNPFHNLAAVFLQSWGNSADEIVIKRPDIETTLRTTLSLVDSIQQTLNKSLDADKLLLVIDQFEELLNFDTAAEESPNSQPTIESQPKPKTDFELFVELLLNAITGPNCAVLLSIRGDYYGSVTERHARLGEIIEEGTVTLRRLDDEQLGEIIEKPAKLGGGQFQDGLAQRISDDVQKQPGNLALLEFALTQLWNHRQGHLLTHDAYDTQVGKLEGAISQKADEILKSPDVSNPKLALAAITRLVRVSASEADGGDTRQRLPLTEFKDEERANLEPFIKARLLVASGSCDDEAAATNEHTTHLGPTLEVAHEALIRHWPTLQKVINGKRPLFLWRQSIRTQYEKWQQLSHANPKDPKIQALALQGYPLQLGLKWLKEYPHDLVGAEPEFIAFSKQLAKNAGRLYRWLGGFAIVLLILIVTGVTTFIWTEQNNANWRFAPRAAWTRVIYLFGFRPDWIPKMQKLEAGSFQMGSDKDTEEEPAQHSVSVKSFSIGIYEVKFSEFQPFIDDIEQDLYRCPQRKPKIDDEGWGLGEQPTINVSWHDAVCYSDWLSFLTGAHFHLPSEAQWEYAVRAGTSGDYYWEHQAEAEAKDFAWFNKNAKGQTHPVGQLKPNAFGLFDMSGNVWEWVADCWHDNYEGAPENDLPWKHEQNGGCSLRVLRGGSWGDRLENLRSANRGRGFPGRFTGIGFRLAQD